ncbi:putative phosphate-induced protein [Rosa chinensis]|uniref:Putative phosphate-induced protein n=1 Tax=Rosa chinensis TaxID=74649 RepID=A0A2P6PIS3_ROSCH|nr:putative phosphate-induced protein [Rosa chinensis]
MTMATFASSYLLLQLLGALLRPAQTKPNSLYYSNPQCGPLLTGKISINLIWYGKFKPSQRAIVSDFITSLSSSSPSKHQPSVATWLKSIEKYYYLSNAKKTSSLSLSLGTQILDESYSLGKSEATGGQSNAINVVLTSSDVIIDGFFSSKCGTHGYSRSSFLRGKSSKFAYIWVSRVSLHLGRKLRDPVPWSMCLAIPSANLWTTISSFGWAASACPGVYGKGAHPDYAGDLLVDATTGASYNANGFNGKKYLLPALFDPSTSTCSTLV